MSYQPGAAAMEAFERHWALASVAPRGDETPGQRSELFRSKGAAIRLAIESLLNIETAGLPSWVREILLDVSKHCVRDKVSSAAAAAALLQRWASITRTMDATHQIERQQFATKAAQAAAACAALAEALQQ